MRHAVILAVFTVFSFHGLNADDDPNSKNEKKRETPSATVVVSATKTERLEKEITTTVSVKTEKEIEQKLIFNILDLVKFEPGVDVSSNPDRQGATSYSIRGIGGNRVLILVDGTNLPDGPEAGRNFSRDFVDLDSLKRVEILRGPSSALYGSDAIGGVVTYTTKDPKDYLANKDGFFTSVKSAYASAYDGFSSTLTVAGANDRWGGLLLGTTRTGHEVKPSIGTPNPMKFNSSNLMGKISYFPNTDHTFNMSVQSFERRNEADLLSLTGSLDMPPGARVTDYKGNDANRRNHFNFDHVFDDDHAFFQRINWRVFYQNAENLERSDEYRTITMPPSERIRYTDYRFRQEILGFRSQAEKFFISNGWVHKILFGLDATQTETSRPYDRTELNLTTNQPSKNVGGILYPSKVMPDSKTTSAGAFLQGEIFTPTGAWSIIPALRFDYYNLEPRMDEEFENSNVANYPINSVSNIAVTPKIGIIRNINPVWTLYGQYANGFRNPPYDNVNMAMIMTMAELMIIPNPDLGPERCNSFELGLRGDNQSNWNFSVATFYSNYTDFITDILLPPDPESDYPTFGRFQFQNLQKVRIYGAEFKGGIVFSNNFTAQASLAYAKGDDLVENEPLDSIAPLKGVIGLGYRNGEYWGIDMLCTLSSKKTRVPTYDFQEGIPFEAPGYTLLDATGYFNFKSNSKSSWRVHAGVFNILDKTYWRWEDVRGFSVGATGLPRYSQPGRNASASLIYSWK